MRRPPGSSYHNELGCLLLFAGDLLPRVFLGAHNVGRGVCDGICCSGCRAVLGDGDAEAKVSAFDRAAHLAALGMVRTAGQLVTVHTEPPTETSATIGKAVEQFGDGMLIGDDRHFITFALAEVGALARGVTVTDEDGKVWALVEEVPGSDKWLTDWTLEPA